MKCPGSVALSEGVEDTGSEAADQGTAAHELGAWCLSEGQDASARVGDVIKVYEDDGTTVRRQFTVDHDMAEHVQAYVDAIGREPEVKLIEERVDYSEVIGVPEQGGTADVLILDAEQRQLQVHDLKYGYGMVYASYEDEDGTRQPNEQLACYAVGAMVEYDLIADWETVKLVIHQPRKDHYDEFVMTREELRAFALSLRAVVAEAESGRQHADELMALGLLRPSGKACQWCPASQANLCPAIRQEVRSNAFDDFEKKQLKDVSTVRPDEVAQPDELDLLETYVKHQRSHIEKLLQAGKKVKGWALKKGRKGARAWAKDQLDVVRKKLKGMKLKVAEMNMEPKLKTPTQIEKVLKPEQYQKLVEDGLITQADGGMTVVPDTASDTIEKPDVAELLGDDGDLM